MPRPLSQYMQIVIVTGLGQLKIANNSYLLSVQQTQSIAIVAAQLNLDAGWIFAGVGRAPLTFTTCTNHAMDVGGSGASTHAVDPLQLTQLALSHMSAASLNLSSTGGAGHIYVYDTVAADFGSNVYCPRFHVECECIVRASLALGVAVTIR